MKNNKEVNLTIFTPTYNRAHTLPRVFESLEMQTLKNFEWLIIDDGSTDSSAQIVNKYAQKDKRMRYFWQENGGKSPNSLWWKCESYQRWYYSEYRRCRWVTDWRRQPDCTGIRWHG